MLIHGKTGNTQTGSQNSTKSLSLQPAAHKYCSWSTHRLKTDNPIRITTNSTKSLRLQPAATNIAAGCLTNREVESNAKDPALNERAAKTNFAHERNKLIIKV